MAGESLEPAEVGKESSESAGAPDLAAGSGPLARFLRTAFYGLVVRPVVVLGLGLNVRHRERLPARGPALVVANHNSHLDAMVLAILLPKQLRHKVRPVAAADYFLRNRFLAWFSVTVLNALPIARGGSADRTVDPLAGASAALDRGDVVLLFPEGTRGEPEELAEFKSGVARLAERFPAVPVVPVFLHGLGKTLPRGSVLPVPFFCDVFVGEPVPWTGDRKVFMATLKERLQALAAEGHWSSWE